MKELKTCATKVVGRFLSRRGYVVLDTGWKSEAGTADIVAKDGDTLVFVKVRARSAAETGFPAECRKASERSERERVALAYLAEHDATDMAIRFDNVSMVIVAPDRAMIHHHINSMCAMLPDEALPEAA